MKDAYAKAIRKTVSAPTAAAKHWAERSTTMGQGSGAWWIFHYALRHFHIDPGDGVCGLRRSRDP